MGFERDALVSEVLGGRRRPEPNIILPVAQCLWFPPFTSATLKATSSAAMRLVIRMIANVFERYVRVRKRREKEKVSCNNTADRSGYCAEELVHPLWPEVGAVRQSIVHLYRLCMLPMGRRVLFCVKQRSRWRGVGVKFVTKK